MMDGSRARAEAPSMEPSAKLFCCGCVRRYLPLVYREEIYHILRMTGPLVAFRILNYLLPFVITMFCGRLGNSVLAGYGMASATISITTAATGGGLALACDTLVSQTFGSKNLMHVGVILQRGVVILLLFCLPCWALLINTQPLLLLLGQDPEVASGSAVASAVAEVYICVFLYAYIRWKSLHAETWGGWSLDSLQDWGAYMKLAIPSTMMLCFEWWIYEIGGFLAGMLSEVDLAAQHAVLMLATTNYMFPLGIQGATCVRVGNALGAGDTAGAILTCKVSLTLTAVLAVLQGAVLACLKPVIGFLFTDDRQIVQLVSKVLTVYCFLEFFDGLVCVCMGILLGSGQQKIAAVANLFGYYCIGLPLGISLMFAAKLEVLGFWLGLLICVCIQSTFFIIVIFKLNWERVTKEAIERTGKMHLSRTQPDFEGNPNQSLVPVSHTSSNAENLNGHQAVSSRDPDENRDSSVDQERLRETQTREESTAPLSTSQLIFRRGLTALAAVLILATGTSLHLTLPLPEVSHVSRTNDTLHLNNTLKYVTPSPQTSTVMSF
ncbi:multidrug and toxin extrusion protein 1-like isoform X2 [Salminus brasiliensis]|uniref:multidrug and toxin extrusion protein 1-like isoform X2 n=1 Tax=Salminus brasiliensis TaxID=930266 RepID=UPI003B838E2F